MTNILIKTASIIMIGQNRSTQLRKEKASSLEKHFITIG